MANVLKTILLLWCAALCFTLSQATSSGTCPTHCSCAPPNMNCISAFTFPLVAPTGFSVPMKRLRVINSQIKDIAARQFATIPSLTRLDISGHNLSTAIIDKMAFAGLPNLAHLTMDSNNLVSLPDKVLAPLTALTALSFQRNRLTSLPSDFLAVNTALQVILFSDNQLKSLPVGFFATNPAAFQISLEKNRLSSLPAHLFANHTNLFQLNLRTQAAALAFPPATFDGVTISQLIADASVGSGYCSVAAATGIAVSALSDATMTGLRTYTQQIRATCPGGTLHCYKRGSVLVPYCQCPGTSTWDGTTCLQNECAAKTHSCDANAECHDTKASYTCHCRRGYAGDGRTCRDDNECAAAATNACTARQTCLNTPGSYVCQCKPGYTGLSCSDINECSSRSTNNCHANATCSNTIGSYTCACNRGYSGNGMSCTATRPSHGYALLASGVWVDIDECAAGAVNHCTATQNCVNAIGSYVCVCKAGYSASGSGSTCTRLPTPPRAGYVFDNRTGQWIDIDECVTGVHTCNANGSTPVCLNVNGSYACTTAFQSGTGHNTANESSKSDGYLLYVTIGLACMLAFVLIFAVVVAPQQRRKQNCPGTNEARKLSDFFYTPWQRGSSFGERPYPNSNNSARNSEVDMEVKKVVRDSNCGTTFVEGYLSFDAVDHVTQHDMDIKNAGSMYSLVSSNSGYLSAVPSQQSAEAAKANGLLQPLGQVQSPGVQSYASVKKRPSLESDNNNYAIYGPDSLSQADGSGYLSAVASQQPAEVAKSNGLPQPVAQGAQLQSPGAHSYTSVKKRKSIESDNNNCASYGPDSLSQANGSECYSDCLAHHGESQRQSATSRGRYRNIKRRESESDTSYLDFTPYDSLSRDDYDELKPRTKLAMCSATAVKTSTPRQETLSEDVEGPFEHQPWKAMPSSLEECDQSQPLSAMATTVQVNAATRKDDGDSPDQTVETGDYVYPAAPIATKEESIDSLGNTMLANIIAEPSDHCSPPVAHGKILDVVD